jgi:multidrug efflux pump subunit AcrA (membrane-fusion protein)
VKDAPHDYGAEKARAITRSLHADELRAAGTARKAALDAADAQLDRVARLLPTALEGGLSLSEIGRITGVSRPTLYELRGRYSASSAHAQLAVLQAIAQSGSLAGSELQAKVGRSRTELLPLIRPFIAQGFVEHEVDEEAEHEAFSITDSGLDLLEQWSFDDEASEVER